MHIPIILTTDDNYAPFIATTIASICTNTKSFCEFYVIDGGISDKNKNIIYDLQKKFNNFSIEFTKIDTEKYFKDFITPSYLTMAAYFRFIMAKLFPNLNKIIYLDVDIIVKRDIKDLYSIDLGKCCLGAVIDQGPKLYISELKANMNMNIFSNYFNAGVLLIDLKKWREQNISDKLFEIEKNFRKKLICGDQDVLNKLFENNYIELPLVYNSLFSRENEYISHYYGVMKPWHVPENYCIAKNSCFKIFWHYAKIANIDELLTDKCKNPHQIQLLNLYRKKRVKYFKPKVSIIIPIYNVEKYLRKCLDSVINQTLKEIEIICVNDCSTDDSLLILKEYEKDDNRIKIIDLDCNHGASFARKKGLEIAKSEYVGFVDSDDWIDLDFYEKLYTKAVQEDADITKANIHIINLEKKKFDLNSIKKNNECNSQFYPTKDYTSALYKASLIKDNTINIQEKHSLPNDTLFINQSFIKSNKLAVVDNVFYHYCRRKNNHNSSLLLLKE